MITTTTTTIPSRENPLSLIFFDLIRVAASKSSLSRRRRNIHVNKNDDSKKKNESDLGQRIKIIIFGVVGG